MNVENKKLKFGLTNNQLKIIAMISMLIDHVGVVLFPKLKILRIIGRLAFPIFAYMIAEGCRYTRNRFKYLLIIAGMGITYQVVYFIFEQSWYLNILITFTLSILSIYSVEALKNKGYVIKKISMVVILILILIISVVLPIIFEKQGFFLDYTVLGVALPILVYFTKSKIMKLVFTAIIMAIIGAIFGGLYWFALLAVPLLAFYNGRRGRLNLKYMFYIFYPLHLVVLYGISILMNM
jgi:hypothetical protein